MMNLTSLQLFLPAEFIGLIAEFSPFTIPPLIYFLSNICLFRAAEMNNGCLLFEVYFCFGTGMCEFMFSQGLNSALAGRLPLLYLDFKVFNLQQLVLTQLVVALDVVAVGRDGSHLGDLH